MELSQSLDFTVTKGSVLEGMTMTEASLEDAAARGGAPISNERIGRGDEVLGTYAVESDAISGGMGSVWRVRHVGWDAELAMKRPQPRFFAEAGDARKAEFVAECENWINLGLHPNIVSCYYVREVGGVPTVFSEWMGGGSLRDAIASGALYEGGDAEVAERVLDVAVQAARGLSYSHGRGLVHQDVKPANVLLGDGWEAKVADFGLARAASQLSDASGARPSGYTPAYCPREQARGAAPAPWMDAYAWALTVLEMYAGGRGWEAGADVPDRLDGLCAQCRIPVPATLRELIGRCLESSVNDFVAVEFELISCYREVVGTDYPRAASRAALDVAGALNNRALSMLDLSKAENAQRLWEQALQTDPMHLESTYNSALHEWRCGRIDDGEAVRRVEALGNLKASELVGELRRESGFSEAGLEFFDCPADLSTDTIRGLSMSHDGNRAVIVRFSRRVELWDLESQVRLLDLGEADRAQFCDGDRAIAMKDYDIVRVADADDGSLVDTTSSVYEEALESMVAVSVPPFDLDSEASIVAFGHDGTRALSASATGAIRYWDVPGRRCLMTFGNQGRKSISWYGGSVALLGIHNKLYRWTMGDEASAKWELSVVQSAEETLVFEDAFEQAFAQAQASIESKDIPAALGFIDEARACEGHENDRRLLELTDRIGEFCVKTGIRGIVEIEGIPISCDVPEFLHVTPDGAYVLVEGTDELVAWDITQGCEAVRGRKETVLESLSLDPSFAASLDHSNWDEFDGGDVLDRESDKVLVLTEEDELVVYNENGVRLVVCELEGDVNEKAVFSSDGRFVFTCDYDDNVYAYHAQTGGLAYKLSGTGGAWSFELSVDMNTLFTMDKSGAVKRWSIDYDYAPRA